MNEKAARKDMRLYEALKGTQGWNPFVNLGKVVRFRCMNCGTLLAVAPQNMQGEWEHKCPLCNHVHVFNRQPKRWGTRYNFEELERMFLR